MKTPIKPEDIRKGDLIRVEYDNEYDEAYEFRAVGQTWNDGGRKLFLLDRPEPPFEPHWGMVIGHPEHEENRAVYIPSRQTDIWPWINSTGDWQTDDWAKDKLANGWVVIAPPQGEEGVK